MVSLKNLFFRETFQRSFARLAVILNDLESNHKLIYSELYNGLFNGTYLQERPSHDFFLNDFPHDLSPV